MVHIVINDEQPSPASGSQAVDRALALLQITGRAVGRGVALSELIAASGLGKPTVRRLMLALIRRGLVEQDGTTRLYHLGEESYVLGILATPRHGLLETAADALVRLAKASGDTAFVSMRRGSDAVCLYREEGAFPIRTHALETGAQHPLGIGAGSLAMLSALPDAEIEALLADNADRLLSDYPNYTAELLRSDVAMTRARGFALNPGRIVAGSWALAWPCGALTVPLPEPCPLPPLRAECSRPVTQKWQFCWNMKRETLKPVWRDECHLQIHRRIYDERPLYRGLGPYRFWPQ